MTHEKEPADPDHQLVPDEVASKEVPAKEVVSRDADSMDGDALLEALQTLEVQSDEETDEPKWDPDPRARRKRLEAVLFMARTPMTTRKLAQLSGLEDGSQARTLIRELNEHYDRQQRAFQVKKIAGGYQMLTRPQFAKWLRKLEHIGRRPRLSGPALETVAVVAYRQPIIKSDIEAIRGVSSGEILRQLLEKGLVKIAGRSEELGRPYLYATTKEFLAQFGLGNLDDLPRAEELTGQGLPDWANSDQISDPKSAKDQPEELVSDQGT